MERTQQIHERRNIKRFREMLGMKQEALAYELRDDWNQKKISLLEAKEKVEADILEQVATILKINPEAIRNFDEEAVFSIINNTYHNTSSDNSTLIASSVNYQPTFNTTDKIVELYERLLQAEKDKVAYLEWLVEKKRE